MKRPELAACKDAPFLFFGPDRESHADRAYREGAAKAVCRKCPVRDECLAEAVTNGFIWGVWGGMGEKERQHYLGRLGRLRAVSGN